MGLYGLTVQKGPWKSTPYTRRQEQTSDKVWRGGGVAGGGTTHAGHGNWYSLMNPQSMSVETGHVDVPRPSPYAYPSVIVPARVTKKGVTVRAHNDSLRNALKDLTRAIDKSGLRPNKYYGGGGPNGGGDGPNGEDSGPPVGGEGAGYTIGQKPGHYVPQQGTHEYDQYVQHQNANLVNVKQETTPAQAGQILRSAETESGIAGFHESSSDMVVRPPEISAKEETSRVEHETDKYTLGPGTLKFIQQLRKGPTIHEIKGSAEEEQFLEGTSLTPFETQYMINQQRRITASLPRVDPIQATAAVGNQYSGKMPGQSPESLDAGPSLVNRSEVIPGTNNNPKPKAKPNADFTPLTFATEG